MRSIMMHLMNLISYVCLRSLESIQDVLTFMVHLIKALGATFELEVVLVVKLPPLTFLIRKSLNLLFPHFLTHAVLMMNLVLTTLFVMDFKPTLMFMLILMPTLMMLMPLPLPLFGFLYLHRLRNRWGHPRYIDLMAGCK